MRDSGINEGDILAVVRTSAATDGQIVISRIGEEITAIRFVKLGKRNEVLFLQ